MVGSCSLIDPLRHVVQLDLFISGMVGHGWLYHCGALLLQFGSNLCVSQADRQVCPAPRQASAGE